MNFEFDTAKVCKARIPAHMTLTQAMLLCHHVFPDESLSYWREVVRYNLGDGREFPTTLVAALIKAYRENEA